MILKLVGAAEYTMRAGAEDNSSVTLHRGDAHEFAEVKVAAALERMGVDEHGKPIHMFECVEEATEAVLEKTEETDGAVPKAKKAVHRHRPVKTVAKTARQHKTKPGRTK